MIMMLSLFLVVVLGLFVYAQLKIKKASEEEKLYTAHYVYKKTRVPETIHLRGSRFF